jgi:hypothetical protein
MRSASGFSQNLILCEPIKSVELSPYKIDSMRTQFVTLAIVRHNDRIEASVPVIDNRVAVKQKLTTDKRSVVRTRNIPGLRVVVPPAQREVVENHPLPERPTSVSVAWNPSFSTGYGIGSQITRSYGWGPVTTPHYSAWCTSATAQLQSTSSATASTSTSSATTRAA